MNNDKLSLNSSSISILHYSNQIIPIK